MRWLPALFLLLWACATPSNNLSPERRLQIACSSYADILEKLAVHNRLGLISKADEKRVDEAVDVIAPVCEGAVPTDPGQILDGVETALIIMIEEANGR